MRILLVIILIAGSVWIYLNPGVITGLVPSDEADDAAVPAAPVPLQKTEEPPPAVQVVPSDNEPEVTSSCNYYEIHGDTTKMLLEQMDSLGPSGHPGNTAYHMDCNWAYFKDSTGYKVCSVKMKVGILYTLPKWVRPENTPQDIVDEWGRFSKALENHEEGHKTIAVKDCQVILDTLKDQPAFPTVNEAKANANSVKLQLWDLMVEKQAAYDKETDHGRKTGTVFK